MTGTSSSTPVGALACQRDAYARMLQATVVSATADPRDPTLQHVLLSDTVLFPEGGGQPADRGYLVVMNDSVEYMVVDVQRKGVAAVHYVKLSNDAGQSTLVAGTKVEVRVDWERRIDAMRQHSGQHLLSAIAERKYGWRTAGWAFADTDAVWSSVELVPDVAHVHPPIAITPDTVRELEADLTSAILAAHPVTVTESTSGNGSNGAAPDPVSASIVASRASAKSIPADLLAAASGVDLVVRTVHIGAGAPGTEDHIDSNKCCGTHVHNTSDMLAIAIKPTVDKVRSGARIYFCAGHRVLGALRDANARESAVARRIGCAVQDVDDKVAKMMVVARADKKRAKTLVDALASSIASAALARQQAGSVSGVFGEYIDSPAADPELLLAVTSAIKTQQPALTSTVWVFAASLADPSTAQAASSGALGVVILGPVGNDLNATIARVKEAMPELAGGGGKGKPGMLAVWQGKAAGAVTDASGRAMVASLMEQQ
ncbi:hypothetical protein BC828DRAFT_389082 [Blastocladiella britannica]|nr:hypothetical protein BC828DRAFT_389082 [Blastocladiella britannica]